MLDKISRKINLWHVIRIFIAVIILVEILLGIVAARLLSDNAKDISENIITANVGNLNSICVNIDNIVSQYGIPLKNTAFVNSLWAYTKQKDSNTPYNYTMGIRGILQEMAQTYIDMNAVTFIDNDGELVVYEIDTESAKQTYNALRTEVGYESGKCRLFMYKNGTNQLILFKRINLVNANYEMYKVGDIMIELELDTFSNIMDFEKIGNSQFFVCNENWNILYADDSSMLGQQFYEVYTAEERADLLTDANGRQYIVSYQTSDEYGINTVALYSYDEMNSIFAMPVRFIVIITLIGVVAIMLLFVLFILIAGQEKKNYCMEMEIKEVQIKEYEKQINPHFLHNSLQMIQMMGLVHDFEGIQEAIVCLGEVLRYSIQKEREVAVSREIQNIEAYFKLLKLRYRERLDYSIVCEDDFTRYTMLKFILQPLVENAVKHGFEQSDSQCRIDIRIKELKDGLIFIVHDTGAGISPERLAKIQAVLDGTGDSEDSVGIGLKNINERVKLFYGSEYGVVIQSEYGVKTDVMVHIPVRYKGDSEDVQYDYC